METKEVGVKPWWSSKINWVSILGALAPFAAMFGLDMTAAQMAMWAATFVALQNLLIFVMRTWFSPEVVDKSVNA